MLRGEDTDQPVNFDLAVQTLNPKTRDDIKAMLIGLDEAIKGRGADFDRDPRDERRGGHRDREPAHAGEPGRRGAEHARRRGAARRLGARIRPRGARRGRRSHRAAARDDRATARRSSPSPSQALGPALADGRAAPRPARGGHPQPPRVRGRGAPGRRRAPAARPASCPRPPTRRARSSRRRGSSSRAGRRDLRDFAPIIEAATPVTEQLLDVTQAGVGPWARSSASTRRRRSGRSRTSAPPPAPTTRSATSSRPPPATARSACRHRPRSAARSTRTSARPGQVELPFIRDPGRARLRSVEGLRGQLHRRERRRRSSADARRSCQDDGVHLRRPSGRDAAPSST